MTKKELEQLRGLKTEIKILTEQLNNIPRITDSVIGSTPDYPYISHTIVIEGTDSKLDRKLYDKLCIKKLKLKYEVNRMEDWLDSVKDSQMRTILRLRFRDGLSYPEIAAKVGGNSTYDNVRKKVDRFLENF